MKRTSTSRSALPGSTLAVLTWGTIHHKVDVDAVSVNTNYHGKWFTGITSSILAWFARNKRARSLEHSKTCDTRTRMLGCSTKKTSKMWFYNPPPAAAHQKCTSCTATRSTLRILGWMYSAIVYPLWLISHRMIPPWHRRGFPQFFQDIFPLFANLPFTLIWPQLCKTYGEKRRLHLTIHGTLALRAAMPSAWRSVARLECQARLEAVGCSTIEFEFWTLMC